MTPQQRRKHVAALNEVAKATHKRYLGKSVLLTGIQSGWIKSLLTIWGDNVRGGTAPRIPKGHACWRGIKGASWSDKALERFTAALSQAREEGYRGQQALSRAHSILWPKPATNLIDSALNDDDADFVEQCVLESFETTDPVYIVGVGFYTTRKKISDISRELQQMAPWLSSDEARRRVKWCLEIFQAKVFLVARHELKK
ncbi:hypothetical protein ABW06_25170 [Pluralibacter gergoviae]|uniref:Uncharacterized protein n=1 Tax=Pluralibacter gergoviae TaxID=61647 RepID=A0A089PUQ7_PLUGE|nr:hypothetical protein [Pluralibacter gergoviae]AIR01964.1 hypothetical protein LG71_19605 [Pluralibacter gergoviae]KMK07621.1 hypothetical protein ABW06_25170 [Pluralibacter gergoviae]KMK25695.1 hypothetical protein ABW10_06835 [Pluralibacter gergoviae]